MTSVGRMMQGSEKEIIAKATDARGNRVGLVLDIRGCEATISKEFITSGKTMSRVLGEYPNYHTSLTEVEESGRNNGWLNREGRGVLHAGAGLLTVTDSAAYFPLRGQGAPAYPNAVAIGVGSTLFNKEKTSGRILYPLITTKVVAETEVVVCKRLHGRNEYLFIMPTLSGLSVEDQTTFRSTIGNGIVFTADNVLNAEKYSITYSNTPDASIATVGKFSNGFNVEEQLEDGSVPVRREGMLIAPEKQKDGYSYSVDFVLPVLMPEEENTTRIMGNIVSSRYLHEDVAFDFEVFGGATDSHELGFTIDLKNGQNPLGRPVLELSLEGKSARVFSGGKVVNKGTLFDVLTKVYPEGQDGRTETVRIAEAFRNGETISPFTGQVQSLIHGPYKSMIFGDREIGLGPMQAAFMQTFAALMRK
jgi:hypothetical protein